MGIFDSRIKKLESKCESLLPLLREEFNVRYKNINKDIVKDARFISEKIEKVTMDYPFLKEKYKNNYDILLELAEDYYRIMTTAGNLLLISHQDDDFASWQRKYRLGMLEIENIEKKFNIFSK